MKFLNRRLIELGLIIAKDSPTGARWGRWGHNGQILEAYGFDLSPMAHRFDEFCEIRDAGRANDALRAQLRRRKTVAIKSIGQIVRTAAESNLDTPPLYALAEGIYVITEGLDPSADRQTLERVVGALSSASSRPLLDEDSRGPSQPLVGAPFQCNIWLWAGAEDRSQGSPRAKG